MIAHCKPLNKKRERKFLKRVPELVVSAHPKKGIVQWNKSTKKTTENSLL